MIENPRIPLTSIHRVEADGVSVFYRQSGPADAPTVLLLHGFPTPSFQYRELIPRLADRYRVIAPDLPGFGSTVVPEERQYKYTFDLLAKTMLAFTEALNLTKYAMYIFDYGLPLVYAWRCSVPSKWPRSCRKMAMRMKKVSATRGSLFDVIGVNPQWRIGMPSALF